jgi:hypothetical protein
MIRLESGRLESTADSGGRLDSLRPGPSKTPIAQKKFAIAKRTAVALKPIEGAMKKVVNSVPVTAPKVLAA